MRSLSYPEVYKAFSILVHNAKNLPCRPSTPACVHWTFIILQYLRLARPTFIPCAPQCYLNAMFSFSGYAEVVEDLPPFLDDNLRKCLILQRINHYLSKRVFLTETTGPILRSSTRRARNRVEPQGERTTRAQAEIFVAEKLSIGHQKEQLEGMIEEEVELNRDTGDFDPIFFDTTFESYAICAMQANILQMPLITPEPTTVSPLLETARTKLKKMPRI